MSDTEYTCIVGKVHWPRAPLGLAWFSSLWFLFIYSRKKIKRKHCHCSETCSLALFNSYCSFSNTLKALNSSRIFSTVPIIKWKFSHKILGSLSSFMLLSTSAYGSLWQDALFASALCWSCTPAGILCAVWSPLSDVYSAYPNTEHRKNLIIKLLL